MITRYFISFRVIAILEQLLILLAWITSVIIVMREMRV